MSGKPKNIDVKVVYLENQTPNVRLESEIVNKDGLLVFSNDHHDGFWVTFKLDDATLKDYRFVNSGMSPMYSALGTGSEVPCPKSGLWDQFKPHDVQERSLTVRNKNVLPSGKSEERFGFTLRVTKDPDGNGEVIDLDPGGINTNGPAAAATSNTVLMVGLGVLVVGAAVLYAAGAFQ